MRLILGLVIMVGAALYAWLQNIHDTTGWQTMSTTKFLIVMAIVLFGGFLAISGKRRGERISIRRHK